MEKRLPLLCLFALTEVEMYIQCHMVVSFDPFFLSHVSFYMNFFSHEAFLRVCLFIHTFLSVYFNTLLPTQGIPGKCIRKLANLARIYAFIPRLQNFPLLPLALLLGQRSVRTAHPRVVGFYPCPLAYELSLAY